MRRLALPQRFSPKCVRAGPVETRPQPASALRHAPDTPDIARIAGYAALFGIADGARDTIVPGAFTRTLAERRESRLGPFPLLWQHRPEQRIGTVDMAQADATGLRIIATIDNPQSRAVCALLARTVNGLSFGYRARGFTRSATGRVLHDIELFEVSLVTHPLQHGARVHLII